MITEADRINQALTDEARDTLHTIISLDGFLALKGEARAARWRGLDHGAKFQLCAQAIARQTGRDWTNDEVAQGIAHYDTLYSLGPVDRAVEGALERLSLDHSAHARAAAAGDAPKDASFFRRAATSYANALIQYRAGVRPELLTSGAYLLPSRRPSEPAHIVHMDGDWTCNCKAGASMHWPLALVIGIEVAHDQMELYDDPPGDNPLGDQEGDEQPGRTPAELGRRLAEMRAQYLAA
jgi:hypothetical protein